MKLKCKRYFSIAANPYASIMRLPHLSGFADVPYGFKHSDLHLLACFQIAEGPPLTFLKVDVYVLVHLC